MEDNNEPLNDDKNENMHSKVQIDLDKFNKTKEEDVGITEFMSPENPGFKCVLKHRYSDFLVNEIGLDGKVVWIKESDSSPQEKLDEDKKKSEELTEEKVDEIIKNNFSDLISEEEINAFNKLIINYIYKTYQINESIDINYIEEKDKRKKLHENIRQYFPFLDSETIENKENKEKKITIRYMTKENQFKRRKVFPDKNKNILLFSLMKKNIDTIGALDYITRLLRRNQKTLKFAGNKDKRGITIRFRFDN